MELKKTLQTAITKGALFLFLMTSTVQIAQADFTCSVLQNPEEAKGYIVTVLEEQFDDPTSTADTIQSLRCIRKTECTEGAPVEGSTETEPGECRSTYVGPGECTPSDTVLCQTVQVLIAQSGLELLFTYIGLIYRWLASVIGIVAVFYIVYGGIKISTAGDNTAAVDEAKTKIIQAIAGLVLLFISAIVLYTINPNFFTF